MSESKLILVVEDDEALRDSVCELLQEVGYRAEPADSGVTAFTKMRALPRKPDLVLLDLMMPGMNGWQFRTQQLEDPELASIPVVVMTASRELRGIAADEVLYKPLKLSKLLSVVESFASQPSVEPASKPAATQEPSFEQQLFAGRSALAQRMRAYDWSRTPLGPSQLWPQSLRSALGICLGSSFPIAIYWGPELSLLYNDAWSPILGSKHPWALGRPGIEVWPELWDTIGPMFEQVRATAESTYSEDSLLLMNRHGYTEECYFNYTFTPIRGRDHVDGIFNAVVETTFRVIAERRNKVLRHLAEATSNADSPETACTLAASALSTDPHDVPFSALYLIDADRTHARLVASSGLTPDDPANDHPAAPVVIALHNETLEPRGLLGLASLQSRVELLTNLDAHVGPLPGGPWKTPATSALVAPIMVGPSSYPVGVLIVGVSPRRAVDEEYRQFVERAAALVATVVANVTALAEERRRSQALTAIDRAKTAFFSNISHEFRTPLTLILGPVTHLLSGAHGELSSEQHRELELIERNGVRLQKLVNALLDFSRIEAGKAQASYEPVNLTSLTGELASAFQSAIESAGLSYTIALDPIADLVFVDRDMWEKIVLNLLSNALKFTFTGNITIASQDNGPTVTVSVSDTGVGISEAHLPRLFERFHRIEGVRSRTHEGSGIGLALVHELAKLHGGSVSVKSEVGVGTTFSVVIPKGSQHLPPEHISSGRASIPGSAKPLVDEALTWFETQPDQTAEATRNDTGDESKAHILLVDDNADMRQYMRRHLEQYWHVEVASNGLAALSMARANVPDLILTDVMMPGLDGFALLHELRNDEHTSNVPVIMLSARSGEEARVDGLQAGAADYLVKPFAARELIARVRTHLQLAALRSELRARHQHLYAVFLQAPIPIAVVFGQELMIELANTLFCELVGHDDVVGKALLDAIPELHGQGQDHLLRTVMSTGQPYAGKELRLGLNRDRDGKVEDVYVNVSYAPFREGDGTAARVIAALSDVTEQVLARHAMDESAARIRFMAEAMPQKIFTADPNGVLTYTNSQWAQFTGLPDDLTHGPNWTQVIHPDDVEENVRKWNQSLTTGQPLEIEHRFRHSRGKYHWHLTRAHLMRDTTGAPVMWVGASTDIDHVKQAEAELQQAVSFSETFVGILGHDLRNPLNAITAAAQLLELRAVSEKIVTPVHRIMVSANRMARMIVQLLDFTRVRLGGGIALLLSKVDLAELSRTIIDELEATHQAGIHLQSLGDVTGSWDHDRLAQLLSNLVANACHHGQPETPVTVHLDGNRPDLVELEVRNGGVIPADLLPVIFEPFRLDATRQKRKGSSGLGLGLYISNQIVMAHAGKIWAESTPEQGTAFHIQLPRLGPPEAQPAFGPRKEH